MNEDTEKILKEFLKQLDKSLYRMARVMKARTNINRDTVVAITGYEGVGKSTLEIILGFLCDPLFNFDTSLLYSPSKDEIKRKVEDKTVKFIGLDEAIKSLYKLNWYSKAQIFLNQLWALCRKENKIAVFCMPRFTDFQEYFRNHRILIWIHIVEVDQETGTGYAVVFKKEWSQFSRDPWLIDINQKKLTFLRGKRKLTDQSIDDKLKLLAKLDNFVTVLRFPKLPPEVEAEYLEHKNAVLYEDDTEEEMFTNREQKQREDIARLTLILKEHGYKIEQLAEKIGRSKDSLYEIVRTYQKDQEKPL